MTTISDAARAVAHVARLLEPAGPVYVLVALGIGPDGYAKAPGALMDDLEALASADLAAPFTPDRAAEIRTAAAGALIALEQVQANEHFHTALKTALAEIGANR
jgi:hypothetical protein